MTKITNEDKNTLCTGIYNYSSFTCPPKPIAYENAPLEIVDPWLEIDAKNLVWNFCQIQKKVGNTPIMAVVKCNAYGHGIIGVAQLLQKQGIRRFATAKVQEAVALRENGIKGTILNLGPISLLEAEEIVRHEITQSVFSESIEILADAAAKLKKQVKVHIKVDTGLSRVGVPYYQALPFIENIASMPRIAIDGIFTTLAQDPDFDSIQIERFKKLCEEAQKKHIFLGIKHVASSHAIANYSDYFLDMVRPGNCFYGLEQLANLDTKPVMSLKTRVELIKKLYPGDTISYYRKKKVEKETMLAILPLGYSDGYPCQAVNKAQVLIRGQRWPIVVYLSTNHAIVDITGSKEIKIGDEVVLFGSQDNQTISLKELAEWSSTNVYHIATSMSPFLPRILVNH